MRVELKCPYELKKANPTDAGWDLQCLEDFTLSPGEFKLVDTGVQLNILQEWGLPFFNVGSPGDRGGSPMEVNYGRGYQTCTKFGLEVQVRGRSGLATKGIFAHVGTVDETYHSPIKIVLYNLGKKEYKFTAGDRVGQIVFSTFLPVEMLPVKVVVEDRGGFGSSGN